MSKRVYRYRKRRHAVLLSSRAVGSRNLLPLLQSPGGDNHIAAGCQLADFVGNDTLFGNGRFFQPALNRVNF